MVILRRMNPFCPFTCSFNRQKAVILLIHSKLTMHHHLINASIQILPVTTDRHPYEWVDEAIAVIKASGIRHEVTPFATVLEGTYTEVMQVIGEVNEVLLQKGCAEWISSLQIQIRSGGDVTGNEKTSKFKN
jgi:uncharacterized protein (TIGR00106 family)